MKIYVRERLKVGKGVKQPRFRVVAVMGTELRIQAVHLRKVELEQIAKDVGADVVYLEPVPDELKKQGEGS
ncbi:MAG: hypothetical protein ACXW1Q_05990 [Halobacteriota archaeon]